VIIAIFCKGYFGKLNVLIKSGFTITNWNPIVEICIHLFVKAGGRSVDFWSSSSMELVFFFGKFKNHELKIQKKI
jgi:hypothetical protein